MKMQRFFAMGHLKVSENESKGVDWNSTQDYDGGLYAHPYL
jgi:hypothetical protein